MQRGRSWVGWQSISGGPFRIFSVPGARECSFFVKGGVLSLLAAWCDSLNAPCVLRGQRCVVLGRLRMGYARVLTNFNQTRRLIRRTQRVTHNVEIYAR